MWLRIPPFNTPGWLKRSWKYSKFIQHPFLEIVFGTTDTFQIKLSGKPYVDVRVLLTSRDLTVLTPYIDFTPDNWDEFQPFSVSGGGTLNFDDEQDIIIPVSIEIGGCPAGYSIVCIGGVEVCVSGEPVMIPEGA